jgi:DNA polymerase-3 subunit chi
MDESPISQEDVSMRVDFYLLSQGAVETTLPRVSRSVKGAGERLLVVSDDEEQLAALDKALWEQFPEDFLAHGRAGEAHAARQPLLLGDSCLAENAARFVAFADGVWRDEGFGFERAFLFFDNRTIDAARGTWRMLGEREDVERHFWKQEGGRWVEGP